MADTIDDNAPWYPEADKEQQELVEKQERATVASVPVIQDVLDWFDKQIAHYSNPTIITGIGTNTDAEQVKQAVLFAQSLIADYERQKNNFKTDFSRYLQEPADEA